MSDGFERIAASISRIRGLLGVGEAKERKGDATMLNDGNGSKGGKGEAGGLLRGVSMRYVSANSTEELRDVKRVSVAEFKRLVETTTKLTTIRMWVTPEISQAALAYKREKGDRATRDRVVDEYARQMSASEWVLSDQGPAFSSDGCRLNGQTRFEANIKAGVAVAMSVTFGVTPRAWATYDPASATRRPVQLIEMLGAEHTFPARRAALIAMIGVIERGRHGVFIGENLQRVATNLKPDLDWLISRFPMKGRLYNSSIAGAFLYAMPLFRNRAQLASALEGYREGTNLPAGSPVLFLRNYAFGGVDEELHPGGGAGGGKGKARADGIRIAAGKALRCLLAIQRNESISIVKPAGAEMALNHYRDLRAAKGIVL